MSTRSNQRVHRSASLMSTRRPQQSISEVGGVLKGTGIAFTGPDTITDAANGLAIFPAGQLITVRGSPLNSREAYEVVTSAAGTLTVLPALIQSEVAGAAIIISLGEC